MDPIVSSVEVMETLVPASPNRGLEQSVVPIKDGPEVGVREFSRCPEKLQWYFMHQDFDMAAGSALSDFFVTTAANSDGRSIADLHQPFHELIGGISAVVVAGNHAGYIGGLTANLAIAKALHKPSGSISVASPGRGIAELMETLHDVYTKLATQNAGSLELSPDIREDIQQRVAAVPVAGGNLSFRDYRNMRTGRQVKAVVKGNDTPLFGPPAWEELHGLLRQLAFASAQVQRELSQEERAFCSESDEQLLETCPDGLLSFGEPLVHCLLQGAGVVCENSEGTVEVPVATSEAIRRCMLELEVAYSNVVFKDVSSIEDSGFAFTHVYSFDMADAKYFHSRNKALVYTCGPNGNKARYPSDVHVQHSADAWYARMRLVGQNVATSMAAYNSFIAKRRTPGLLPITVLRTPLVAGGAFMLRDSADPSKLLVSSEQHACSYQQGLLRGLVLARNHGLRRIELMHTKMKPEENEIFQEGFDRMQMPSTPGRTAKLCHINSPCKSVYSEGWQQDPVQDVAVVK